MSDRDLTPGEALAARARAIACARARTTGVPHAAARLQSKLRDLFPFADSVEPWVVGPSHHEHRELLSVAMIDALPSSTLVRHGVPHPEEAGAR